MIDIKRGATFEGASSYLGVPFMLIGIMLFIATFFPHGTPLFMAPAAIAFFWFGFVIFQARRGVMIDIAQRRFRPYRDLVLFRIGGWLPLSKGTIIIRRERFHYANDTGITQSSVRSWVFPIILTDARLPEEILLKEEEDLQSALATAKRAADALGWPIDDRTALKSTPSSRRR